MKKPKVAIVGSLNMDLVVSMQRMPKLGETLTGDSMAVGEDGFGQHILEDMKRYGVSDSAARRIYQTLQYSDTERNRVRIA